MKENVASLVLPTDRPSKTKSADFYKRVEAKVSEFDVKGALKLLSSNESFAKANADTLSQLQSKHPQPSRPLLFPPPPTNNEESFQATQFQVKKAISSFANRYWFRPGRIQATVFQGLDLYFCW